MKLPVFLPLAMILGTCFYSQADDYHHADVNRDREVNIADVNAVIDAILGTADSITPIDPPGPVETITYVVNGVSFTMVQVDGGTFDMGATAEQDSQLAWADEYPVHRVTLSTYSIGATEVTQALWMAVMDTLPCRFKSDPMLPVESVSWNDCQEFIARLNALTGMTFRLPTEAEWEYAARGGNRSRGYQYSGGNDVNAVAWWGYDNGGNSDYGTNRVAQKLPNELGIYDMSGNVWEWCQDWYRGYNAEPQTNPTGPSSGQYRIYRGGSWNNDSKFSRISFRFNNHPEVKLTSVGLRLAL